MKNQDDLIVKVDNLDDLIVKVDNLDDLILNFESLDREIEDLSKELDEIEINMVKVKIVNKFGDEITPSQFVSDYSNVDDNLTEQQASEYFTNKNLSDIFTDHEYLPESFLKKCVEYYNNGGR